LKFSPVKLISTHLLSIDKAAKRAGIDAMFKLGLDRYSDILSSIDLAAYTVEREWKKASNRQTIFPSSPDFLNYLANSKFDLGKGAAIHAPWKTFAISFPRNYTIDGVHLGSCLIQITTPGDRLTQLQDYVSSISEIKHVKLNTTMSRTEEVVYIYFVSPWGDRSIHGMVTPMAELPSILGSEDTDVFRERIGNMGESNSTAIGHDSNESSFNQQLLKLVAAMLIYNTATEGKGLTKGLPKHAPVLSMKKQGVVMKGSILGDEHKVVTPHARRMHFRNLQHERFYGGEYSNMDIGSRWVLVKASTSTLKPNCIKSV
jgi:hypothetical protein